MCGVSADDGRPAGRPRQRREHLVRLAAELFRAKDEVSPFPWATIALDGALETRLTGRPAIEVEDDYRAILKRNRSRDAAAGRTLEGPHLSDLRVLHGPKSIEASEASTGEQKALLLRLVLAHAGLVAKMTGCAPVLLLDEVSAHLDPDRRAALFTELARLGGQVWMTGADPAVFAEVSSQAQRLDISLGRIEPPSP